MSFDPEVLLDDAPAPMPACGSVVGGKYRILRAIGKGGMGAVFEAENVLTLKHAAVKWLHPRFMPQASAQERMLREARATARIRHRNVVDLYDVVLEGSAVVLVMELLTGELLADRLARESVGLVQLIGWLLQAMEGVVAAHAAGVVHRDLKPENIFLARDSAEGEVVPKVIDFGISKTSGADLARLTQSGMAMGTPRYISFEQLRGDATVDARSDIYAIGVVLYEALVGRPPYQANSLGEQAIQFLTHDPPAPKQLRPELPDVLSALTFKAIARDREQRFESMEAFIKDLRPFAQPSAYPSPMLAWAGSPLSTPGAFGNELSTLPVAPSAELPAATSPVASLPPPAVLRRPVRRLVGLLLATIVLSVVWAYWPHALRTGGTESAPLVTAKVSIDGAPGVSSRADTPSVSGASLAPAKAVARDELATGADRDAAETPREVQSLAREAAQRVPRSATSAAPSARGGLNKRANKPSVAVQTLLAASLSEATTVPDPVAQDAGVQEDSRHRAGRVARDQF